MKKGLGNVKITELGHDQLTEIHFHTWLIMAGAHKFLFHGAISSLDDAVETVKNMTNSPYKPKVKKV
jgi:hypothetical protein